MRKCLSCDTAFDSLMPLCSSCGWQPEQLNDICAYAPALAKENAGFKVSHFTQLAALEAHNFWFNARNKLIIQALKKYSPDFKSLMEIGCGTGFVLSGIINAFPGRDYKGSELLVEGLSYVASRQSDKLELIQMDARRIPFHKEFDCIGIFDVLEHIQEDEMVLSQIHNALNDKGILLLTVPQHKWLWSKTDEDACHVRRYSAAEIEQKVTRAGFELLCTSSFVFSLLPLMMISRFLKKFPTKNEDPFAEFQISPTLNRLLTKILNIEVDLINKGIRFPLGGSRLIVARKSE